jgi:hypothetical protein
MKSRRRIAAHGSGVRPILADYIRDLPPAKWGSGVSVRGRNPEPLMSALGQKRTFRKLHPMSALPPKADIDGHSPNVRFVPKANIGLMDCAVMKGEKANLVGGLLPPKVDHCGLQ